MIEECKGGSLIMRKKAFWAGVLAMVLMAATACAENISPTTGLSLEGEPTAPMLAVISHTEGSTENGKLQHIFIQPSFFNLFHSASL